MIARPWVVKDPKNGRFKRYRQAWTPRRFNDGYICRTSKRFFVYFPDSASSRKNGYALRSHAVWETYNGPVPPDHVIHHKNGDKLDDRIENLSSLTKIEHDDIHGHERRIGFYKKCEFCDTDFYLPKWRLNDGRPGTTCGQRSCALKAGWKTRRAK